MTVTTIKDAVHGDQICFLSIYLNLQYYAYYLTYQLIKQLGNGNGNVNIVIY